VWVAPKKEYGEEEDADEEADEKKEEEERKRKRRWNGGTLSSSISPELPMVPYKYCM